MTSAKKARGSFIGAFVHQTRETAQQHATDMQPTRQIPITAKVFARDVRVDRLHVPVWIVVIRAALALSLFAISAPVWAQGGCNPYTHAGCDTPGPSDPGTNPYTDPPTNQPTSDPYQDPTLAPGLPTIATAASAWAIGNLANNADVPVGFIVLNNQSPLPQVVTITYSYDPLAGRLPLTRSYNLGVGVLSRLSIPLHGDPAFVNMYFSATVFFEAAGSVSAVLRPDPASMKGQIEPQVVLLPKPQVVCAP